MGSREGLVVVGSQSISEDSWRFNEISGKFQRIPVGLSRD